MFGTGFTDTFNSNDPAWVTDRMDPAGFNAVGGVLKLDIAGADHQATQFYNTQGKQHVADVTGNWTVSGQLQITSGMFSATSQDVSSQWATSLWARTTGTEAEANYPIIRIQNLGSGAMVEVWDPAAGGYVTAFGPNNPVLNEGWNDFSILGTASGFSYWANGVNFYNDLTLEGGTTDLSMVFLQGHNLGADRTYYWDNVSAGTTSSRVPEGGPGLVGLSAILAVLALGAFKARALQALA
jgi:hypothetical protein